MNQQLLNDEGYTTESWEYARAFAYALGTLPSSFTSVIRLLLTDHDKNPSALSDFGRFFAGRLLRSASLQAPYYGAIKYFKPTLLEDPSEPFEVRDFLDAFSGYEHASLLAAIFIHRHSKKLCETDLIRCVTPLLQQSLNLGWLVGNALPSVGPGPGLLIGGFRVFGFLPFLKHDPHNFSTYLSYLSENKLSIDVDYEYRQWQCNSLQVALMMCQQLGFGIKRVIPLMKAITTTSPLINNDEFERAFRALDVWMVSISKMRSAPSIPMPPKYYPTKSNLDVLLMRGARLNESPHAAWLTNRKEDLSPETAPQLFVDGIRSATSVENDVPVDLAGALPDDSINELSSKLMQEFLAEEEPED
jgi:hypothetical protein